MINYYRCYHKTLIINHKKILQDFDLTRIAVLLIQPTTKV